MDLKSEFEAAALVHLDAVYRTGIALCGVKDLADDLVQTAFAKAFENFGSFKKGTNCKAWLIRILRNTWIDYLHVAKWNGEWKIINVLWAWKPR